MSVSCPSFRSECDSDYAVDSRGSFEKISRQNCRPRYRRSGTAPGSVNGMHRRRQSSWTWGHGRGARISNLRAFAGCAVAAILVALSSAASAEPISMETVAVLNKANAGNPSAPSQTNVPAFSGSVNYNYLIGKYEVTNAQYAAFLNSVATTSDPSGLYDARMSITKTTLSGTSTYASTNPTAATRPINFVRVSDAQRFANWIQNGMGNGGTETGAYTFTSGTQTTPAVRNPGAQVWIPNTNEWYKAAFYSPLLNSGSGGYYTQPTATDTITAAAAPSALTGRANFANANGATSVGVGQYVNSASYYGAYDMAGNVAEWTDTPTTANNRVYMSSWFGAPANGLYSNSTNSLLVGVASVTAETANIGFRVAMVPEPSTYFLAGIGIATATIGARLRRNGRK